MADDSEQNRNDDGSEGPRLGTNSFVFDEEGVNFFGLTESISRL